MFRNHKGSFQFYGYLHRIIAAAAWAVLLSGPWSLTQAQTVLAKPNLANNLVLGPSTLYPAKFLCGFVTGFSEFQSNVLAPIPRYGELEPGHYSTVLNLLNASRQTQQNIQVHAVVQGESPVLVSSITLEPFHTHKVTCFDIVNELDAIIPGGAQGQLIEGFVYVLRNKDVLDIEGVYTYASKDMYVLGGIAYFDTIAEFGGSIEAAGAGAGGLGLGASIDVVKIEARTVEAQTIILSK